MLLQQQEHVHTPGAAKISLVAAFSRTRNAQGVQQSKPGLQSASQQNLQCHC